MAVKYYCDVCGKELKYEDWNAHSYSINNYLNQAIDTIELCPEHAYDFLNMVKKIKENKK